MWKHGFDMHRVYLCTPGDLSREQDICREAMAEVNETDAMPSQILLVPVALMDHAHAMEFRAAVADNIRQCAYFVQVFEDDWGPKAVCRKLFFLATECRDDATFPMQEVVVCLKDAPREKDPEILEFRAELEQTPGVRVLYFDNPDTLKAKIAELFKKWVGAIARTHESDQAQQRSSGSNG
jgi:hypothetical protein